jgi:hypothetical protein
MKDNLALGCVLVLSLAAPSLAGASQADARKGPAMGPAYFTGTWEDPMPREILRPELGALPERPAGPTQDPPLKPEYLEAWKAEARKNAELIAKGEVPLTANAQCQPPGFPGMMGPVFPIEVLQTPGQVTITQEAYSQTRRIYLNEKQIAFEDAEPTYYGHSVGHWEGNVLYVNTVGLKDFIRNRNIPHSDQLSIDEKITVAPEHVTIEFTQTDPVYLTKPYQWKVEWKKRHDYKMNEFVCENNRIEADPVTGLQRLKVE